MNVISFASAALMLMLGVAAPMHAVGAWLAIIIGHGVLVEVLGDSARNLPFVAAMGMVLALLIRRRVSTPDSIAASSLLLLVLLMAAASMTGLDPSSSLFWTLQYLKAFVLAVIVGCCVNDAKEARLISIYLLVSLAVGALLAVWQYRSGTGAFQGLYEQRSASLRGDPNDTAMLLVAGMPLAIWGVMRASGLMQRALCAVAGLTILAGLVVTGSRGGFVSLLLVFAAMYWRFRSVGTTVAAVIFVAVAAALVPSSYWERMETLVTGHEQNQGESLQNRAALLGGGLTMVSANPMFGVGPGNFGRAFVASSSSIGQPREFSQRDGSQARQVFGVAHNLHLEFFAECGVPAGVLLLFLFGRGVLGLARLDGSVRATSAPGLGHALAVSLSAMLFAGLFLSQGKNPVLWFLVGLGFAGYRLSSYRQTAANDGLSPVPAQPLFPQIMR